MEQPLRYTLGKNERLKSRKAIDELFSNGKSWSQFPLRVLYKLSLVTVAGEETAAVNPIHLRAGFTVSSRNFKRAVDRNRVKRLLRECYRLQKNDLELTAREKGCRLSLFLIFTGKTVPDYPLVAEKTAQVMARLIKLINEQR